MTVRPASHSQNNFTDKQSTSLIDGILSAHGRVIANISTVDKWPNRDGHLDVQDENRLLIGSLPVQVKTLKDSKKLKHACPVSFLAYCDQVEACLLLVADNENRKVYWRYIDAVSLKDVDYKSNKSTKTIDLNEDQYFSDRERSYIDAWTLIIENNKRKMKGYDDLAEAYGKLKENANELVGVDDEKHMDIHHFLDELNRQYDYNFPTAKRFFYSDTWKLGVAYEEYTASTVTYTIYPIGWKKNDVQIKRVDAKFAKESRERGLGFRGHFVENPISDRPLEYAKEVAGEDAQKLTQRKLLSISGNAVLANEIVIAFMDKFHEQMGFSEPLDEYDIRFISHGFNNYLPIWVHEAYKVLSADGRSNINEQIQHRGYFDPDVLWQIKPEERELIKQNVSKNLGKVSPAFTIANSEFDVGVFLEALKYLQDTDTPAKRVYRRLDFSRLDTRGNLIWNTLSIDDAEYNAGVVIDNLEDAYGTLVSNNFPGLKSELPLLGDANELLIHYEFQDTYDANTFGPIYREYYLRHDDHIPRIPVKSIDKSEADKLEGIVHNKEARKKNMSNSSRLVATSRGRVDFLYSKMPLMTLVYKILEDRLKAYLNQ